ncbi:MAG TPA: DUF3857 domain-containing protein [Rhodothermales bacterium]|nr:DUF3857 domain-containing protein [Rhodothermales bacterium]
MRPQTLPAFLVGTACLLLSVFAPLSARAQDVPEGIDPSFRITPESEHLRGNASVVVRLAYVRFEVKDAGHATEIVHRVATVADANGRHYGAIVIPYDKFIHIKSFEGRIRDAGGKVVRKLKKRDIRDVSAISGFSLYEDNRIKYAELVHDIYPYTVEFSYELERDGLLSWPIWAPQEDEAPVEHAVLEIIAPGNMKVRYSARGTQAQPTEAGSSHGRVLRWTFSGLPEREPEPFGPSLEEQAPVIYTGPSRFEIEGTEGDMSTWASFGAWYAGLIKGRDQLPPEAVAKVEEVVAGAQTDLEKVERLYRYLQSTTRYVSIQLGLGGWRPYDAEYVYRQGYGDCKALVNYMAALLKAAGVLAYPALIDNGYNEPDVQKEFPTNQFNHVVLFIPLERDTLWLECTSQTMPFGRVGGSNEDRWALAVTPEGGKLVRTPRSGPRDNMQVRRGRIVLQPDGNAVADVRTEYTGNAQDRLRIALAERTDKDRDEWLRSELDLPSFELLSADFSSVDARGPSVSLPVKLKLGKYGSRTGDRIFFRPDLLEHWTVVPPTDEKRAQPVVFAYAFAAVDTLTYELPAGYHVEAAPAPVKIETPFASYVAEVSVGDEGVLRYIRHLEVSETTIPPEQYGAFRDLATQASRADNAQVVLVRDNR